MTTPDERHWVTTDGHRYTSVPAPVPVTWRRMRNDSNQIVYVSGCYSICRSAYGVQGAMFTVHRDGIQLSPLAFYPLLWQAKDRAALHAEGRDVVNHA